MDEQTLVLLKPDAVKRGLIGKILSCFEEANLRIRAMRMLKPSREIVKKHYPETEEWFQAVGEKTLDTYSKYGFDPVKEIGTEDPVKIGKLIKGWLIDYITSGDVLAIIVQGNRAVDNVRRIVGNTIPLFADPGSIRGRFSIDSPDIANAEKRPVHNLVHASGNLEEAKTEISMWFSDFKEE